MVDDLIAFVADKGGCSVEDVEWYSWPQVFGSASGPRGGISAQVVTTFQVYAFTALRGLPLLNLTPRKDEGLLR